MLSSIFQKRRKIQELRSPALQDIKKFRDVYARNAERRHVETPSCLEKSVYKAISCQKELHSVDFRQEDITDPQLIALAETLLEMPMISYLDLRDNRITDDGAKALLEVLRLQIIAAKTPLKTDPKTKLPIIPSVPEYTRYVTQVLIKGNEVSAAVLQELAQYTEILKREDKRVEIRAALAQIDRNSTGGIDEDEFKAVLKLLTGTEPSRKEVKMLMQQHTQSSENLQKSAINLENLLLAKCSASPSKKAACPPWEALVQVRHATLGHHAAQLAKAKSAAPSELLSGSGELSQLAVASVPMHRAQSQPISQRLDAPSIQVSSASSITSSSSVQRSATASNATSVNAKLAMAMPPPPPLQPSAQTLASPTHSQQQSPVSSRSSSSDQSSSVLAKLRADFKPPASPPPPLPLSLPSTAAAPVSSSPDTKSAAARSLQSFASSSARESQDSVSIAAAESSARETPRAPALSSASSTDAPVASIRGASSPDRASVYSSSSSFSQYVDGLDAPRQSPPLPPQAPTARTSDETEKKRSVPPLSIANSVISESPRWRDEDVFTDDEDDSDGNDEPTNGNGGGEHGAGASDQALAEDTGRPSARTSEGHSAPGITASSETAAASLATKPERRRRMDSGTITSDVVELSDGEGETVPAHRASHALSDATGSSNERDLSSLIYREATDSAAASRRQQVPPRLLLTKTSDERAALEPETNDDDDESDEHFDVVVADVMKDGKPRSVARVKHSALKRGLLLKDVPSDVPFRNLVALTLSENGLSSLDCLKDCRFPCATVLDLSKNRLAKIGDDDLVGFPKLQVLDLSHNRLRSFQGLGRVFDLRALNGDHNAMKTVKNIEHLVQLQVLQVASNFIGNIAALRLLSLNKMLTHVDLDGNPIVETDERQKRRNIVHILNLIPTLRALGSIPVASLHSKEKKLKSSVLAASAARGKALYDVDGQFPGYEALWTTRACDVLHCFQDVSVSVKTRSSYNNDESDDPWSRDDGSADDRDASAQQPRKPLNSKQQRQKDELRSRAVGYRSRAKAMPSPPKVKTSVYSFGPPVPPPPPSSKKSAKKAPPADPRVVKQQQRRASELSAPKHQPVDTTLLSQEQKRKSRPTFDVNMSVAERLLLAQEKAQRRSSSIANSKRASMATGGSATMHRTKSVAVASGTSTERHQPAEGVSRGFESPSSQSSIPARSPTQDVVAFRIEPLPSRSPSPAKRSVDDTSPHRAFAVSSNDSVSASADSHSPGMRPASPTSKMFAAPPSPSPPPKSATRESSFLQDLAVTDFLTHADEELSTALTALNVLLRMCERKHSDTKKLAEYRSSLEALDILDERESHALFAKIRDYTDHARASECAQAFAKLGTVKQSLRALLAQLEAYAPGSDAVRAFCRSLRSSELQSILSAPERSGDADVHEASKDTSSGVSVSHETVKASSAQASAPASGLASATIATVVLTVPSVDLEETSDKTGDAIELESLACRSLPEDSEAESTDAHSSALSTTNGANASATTNDEDEFDFLSNDRSVFDNDDDDQGTARSFASEDAVESEKQSVESPLQPSDSDDALEATAAGAYAVMTDIAQEIQQPHDDDNDDEWLNEAPAVDDLKNNDDDDASAVESKPLESSHLQDDNVPAIPAQGHDDNGEADDDAWLTTDSPALDDVGTDAADASVLDERDTGDADVPDDDDWFVSETSALDNVDTDVDTLSSAFEDERAISSAEETPLYESSDAAAADAPTEDCNDVDTVAEVMYDDGDDSEAFEPETTSDCADEASLAALETALAPDDDEDAAVAAEPLLSEAEDADDEEAEIFGDWEKGFDPSTNHYFWFNHATGESAWTPPEDWPFEVDTPFETEDEYGDGGESADAGDAYDTTQDESADAVQDEHSDSVDDEQQQACAGEDRALESSHRALSDVDDDLFSDQDLPSF